MSEQDRYEACARDLFARIREDFGDEIIVRGKKYKFEQITESDIDEFTFILRRHFEPTDERIEEIAKKYGERHSNSYFSDHETEKHVLVDDFIKALRELRGE